MMANRRTLFVCTILLGSFLLFLVQPMVARMALPRLGGAPNVWNSAMLVYQALLLGGYAYAHALGRVALKKQALVHLAVLLLAALTLPIALADLPPAAPGAEVVWVPLLFLATIGPLFFAVSAQAPLMQRWYAADPRAGLAHVLGGDCGGHRLQVGDKAFAQHQALAAGRDRRGRGALGRLATGSERQGGGGQQAQARSTAHAGLRLSRGRRWRRWRDRSEPWAGLHRSRR